MQTRVGTVPHIAGDKAAHRITRVFESMAENKGEKTGKGTGVEEEHLFVLHLLMLLNLALFQMLFTLALDLTGLRSLQDLLGIILLLRSNI